MRYVLMAVQGATAAEAAVAVLVLVPGAVTAGCVLTGLVTHTAARRGPASGYQPGGVAVALAAQP